jgi:undecaprenyl-diphosphatase
MPFLLLLLVTFATGALVTLAAARVAPAEGATSAASESVEEAVISRAPPSWWSARLDPTVATGLALTAAVAMMIGGGLVIALLAYLARGNAALASLDSGAAAWGNHHAGHLSTRLLTLVTDLGDWPAVPVIGAAVALVELYRAPNRFLVPFLLVVVLGDQLVTTAIKSIVDRARPTLNPIAHTLGPSFPSGHSSTAACFYAALALILARRRGYRARALLTGGAAAIAVAVAASRVLLDVHWVSDVVAGVLLGWAWFALCAVAFGGRLLQFGAPLDHTGTDPRDAAGKRRADTTRDSEGVSRVKSGKLAP